LIAADAEHGPCFDHYADKGQVVPPRIFVANGFPLRALNQPDSVWLFHGGDMASVHRTGGFWFG
jgi:hypothetical protein